MNLYFLRHGIAVERGDPAFREDAQRPLTPKGRRQLRKVAAASRTLELGFAVIWSSPLVRAWQTAEMVAKELKLKRSPTVADELKPGGDVKRLIQKMAALRPPPENLLLVGHEPDLGELISLLVSGHAMGGFALKKGGLAKLEVTKLRVGQCATLSWLLTPGQMKRLR